MTRTALLTAVLVALAACGGDPQDPNVLVASGHVEATDVRLSTKFAGRLQDFNLAEGDTVKAGQEIAHIDTTDVDLAVAQARAERQASEAARRTARLQVACGHDRDAARSRVCAAQRPHPSGL